LDLIGEGLGKNTHPSLLRPSLMLGPSISRSSFGPTVFSHVQAAGGEEAPPPDIPTATNDRNGKSHHQSPAIERFAQSGQATVRASTLGVLGRYQALRISPNTLSESLHLTGIRDSFNYRSTGCSDCD
jgi:hypothetical protein